MLSQVTNPMDQVLLLITTTTFCPNLLDLVLFFTINQNQLYIGTSPITTTRDIQLYTWNILCSTELIAVNSM